MSRLHAIWSDEIRPVSDPRRLRKVLWVALWVNCVVIVADSVGFSGLLLLLLLLPVGGLVLCGHAIRRNSRSLTRWRMAQCRRHIEEMEIELGWRSPALRPRPTPAGYSQRPAGAYASAITAAGRTYQYQQPSYQRGNPGLSLGKYIGIGR